MVDEHTTVSLGSFTRAPELDEGEAETLTTGLSKEQVLEALLSLGQMDMMWVMEQWANVQAKPDFVRHIGKTLYDQAAEAIEYSERRHYR